MESRNVLRYLLSLAIGGSVLVPGIGAAQDALEHRGDAIAWQYDLRGDGGVVRGQILNEDGEPVEGVQVAMAARTVGAVTDEDGRFEIRGLEPGPVDIEMMAIGMTTYVRETVVVPSDASVWISAVVTFAPIGGRCGDMVARGDGIFAVVRDSVTGQLPSVPLTLKLERGGEVWESTQELWKSPYPDNALLSVSHRVETAGEYAIEVSAPGYRTWRVEEVWLEPEWAVCSLTAAGRYYTVRLVPVGSKQTHVTAPTLMRKLPDFPRLGTN